MEVSAFSECFLFFMYDFSSNYLSSIATNVIIIDLLCLALCIGGCQLYVKVEDYLHDNVPEITTLSTRDRTHYTTTYGGLCFTQISRYVR